VKKKKTKNAQIDVRDAMIGLMTSMYDFSKTSFESLGNIIYGDVFCFRIIEELKSISIWNW